MATIRCQTVKNSEAKAYCFKAESEGGLEKISQAPLTQLLFSTGQPERIRFTNTEDLFTLQLFQDQYDRAYKSELQRGRDYLASLQNGSHSPLHPSTLPIDFQNTHQLPWGIFPTFFEDGQPNTQDDALLKWSLDRIYGFQIELEKRGIKAGTDEYDLEMLRKLLQFCSSPKGWGLKFSKTDHLPRTPLGSFHHKKVDCFNFENLFLTLSRLAGLDTFPIEVFRNSRGEWISHVEVAMRLHQSRSSEVFSVDFQNGKIISRSETNQGNWSEITPLELLSLAYVNWATDSLSRYYTKSQKIPEIAIREQIDKLEKALLYSRHYLVLANYAACLFHIGDEKSLKKGEKIFAEAFKINPFYFQETEIGKSIAANYQKVREETLLSANFIKGENK